MDRRRRTLAHLVPVAVITALSFALVASASANVGGFRFGVAAGEVTSKNAVLWGATKKPGKVDAEVATSKKFKDKDVVQVAKGKAKGGNDNTVQVEVGGLKPGTKHFFRFCEGNKCSDTGQFETAPKSSKNETIDFAYTGDTDATPAPGTNGPVFNNFETFKAMQKEKNTFNVHMGDTIYSDSEVGGTAPALTVEEKWAKYRTNLELKNYPKLRGSAAYYSQWDDHEFINDFSIPEDGEALYDAGVKAFTDYAPVSYSEQDGLYRTFRWGMNLEVFILDQRSFRSAKASDQCINPQSGQPDLAPTAPQNVRNVFGNLVPSLNQPVSQTCKDTINDPSRTLLGSRQFNRFLDDVSSSNARWKVVLNETPIQQFYALPYDRWEGYAHERIELLNQLASRNVQNLVFLTTDTHAYFANVIRLRTLEGDSAPSNAPAGPADTAYNDYVAGPVATNTFWKEIDDVTGSPGNGQLISQAFFKPPPPNGMGMFCAQGDVYGYGEVQVSGSTLTVTYKDQNGNPITDVNGEPCGPYALQAQ